MNKIKSSILFGIITSVFVGCTGITLPPLKTFTLESTKECCIKNKLNKQNLTIKVIEPIATKHLNTTNIYYSDNKYLLETYKLSKWGDYPTKMILKVLTSKLDELNLYNNIITSQIYAKSNFTLQSELLEFRQIIDNSKARIKFKIKFYLLKNSIKKEIFSKTFKYQIKCNSVNAYGAIDALNKSMDLLINDLSIWLQNNTKEQK